MFKNRLHSVGGKYIVKLNTLIPRKIQFLMSCHTGKNILFEFIHRAYDMVLINVETKNGFSIFFLEKRTIRV